jgi:hypothetical protein
MKIILEQLGLMDAAGSLPLFFERAAEAGIKAIRMFYLCNFSRENEMCPFKKIGRWTAGGRGDFPFYDHLIPSLDYWHRFDLIHQGIKQYGMEVHGVLRDRCSWDYGNDRFNDPYWSSIQKYPDPNDKKNKAIKGGIYGEEMKPLHADWFAAVVNRLNELQVPYKLEVENEFRNFPMHERGYTKNQFFAWMHWAVRELESLGCPRTKIITSILDEDQWHRYYGLGTIYSHHGCVTPKKADRLRVKMLSESDAWAHRIIFSGDGGRDGKGDKDPNPKKGWKGLGEDDAETMGGLFKAWDIYGYGYMSRASKPIRGPIKKGGQPENLDKVNFGPAKRMYLTVNLPVPEPPQPPTPEPPPLPPTPPPARPCSYYFKRLNFKRWFRCLWNKL